MNLLKTPFVCLALICVAQVQLKANHLLEFLDTGKELDAEFFQVNPDPSIEPYIKLINEAEAKDPKWFTEHAKLGKPGTPLKFHEKLMTKEQYDAYLAAWEKREIVPVKNEAGSPLKLKVLLEKEGNDYVLYVSGVPTSTLSYSPKTDSWSSMLGELNRIDDIKADKDSFLRAWTGYEWKSEKQDGATLTKQNMAIGRSSDKKFGYIVYRFQQSVNGQAISNKSHFVRFFPVKKAKK